MPKSSFAPSGAVVGQGTQPTRFFLAARPKSEADACCRSGSGSRRAAHPVRADSHGTYRRLSRRALGVGTPISRGQRPLCVCQKSAILGAVNRNASKRRDDHETTTRYHADRSAGGHFHHGHRPAGPADAVSARGAADVAGVADDRAAASANAAANICDAFNIRTIRSMIRAGGNAVALRHAADALAFKLAAQNGGGIPIYVDPYGARQRPSAVPARTRRCRRRRMPALESLGSRPRFPPPRPRAAVLFPSMAVVLLESQARRRRLQWPRVLHAAGRHDFLHQRPARHQQRASSRAATATPGPTCCIGRRPIPRPALVDLQIVVYAGRPTRARRRSHLRRRRDVHSKRP